MNFNLENAVKAGLNASIDRERNIEEINRLIEIANLAVLNTTGEKVGLGWRNKTYNVLGAFAHLSVPLSDERIEDIQKEERILYVYKVNDKMINHDLTILNIHPNGFPCEMNFNGNKHVSHDIDALGEAFETLLSSVHFGQKVRSLML